MTTTLATSDLIEESRTYEIWDGRRHFDSGNDYLGPTVALSPEDRTTDPEVQS